MNRYNAYIGQIFDERYRIESILGVGGMAAVMYAYDQAEQKYVAIKMLKEELCENKEAVARFINESKAVSMLHHPNIVKVKDVVISEEKKYLVMEYIEGETLRDYMDSVKVIPYDKCVDIIRQVLSALDHAHSAGVIHRDIKPQNILIKGDKVIVTDFGIAMISGDDQPLEEKAIGTVYYISPEQASGEKIDHRSDLYSVGVMLFEMLIGKLPFDDEETIDIALKQINEQPPSPRDLLPTIPVGMEQFILYALNKDPNERFQSAEQMLEYLDVISDDPFAKFAETPRENFEKDTGKEKKTREEDKPKKNVRHVRGDSWSPMPIVLGVLTALFIVFAVSAFYAWENILEPSSLNVFADRSGEDVVIGDYVGQTFTEEDKNYLEDVLHYGVNNVTIIERFSELVEKGKVIEQDPKGGEVRKLSSVKLTVVISKGSSVVENRFPDYRMEDYRVMRLRLLEAGYTVVLVPAQNTAVEKNKIIATEPAPGEKVTEGMTVRLYYSVGPAAESIVCYFPDFVSMTETEAKKVINENGMNLVEVKHEFSDVIPSGCVISSSVPVGPRPRLTPLTIVISLGADPDKPQNSETTPEDTGLFVPEYTGEIEA